MRSAARLPFLALASVAACTSGRKPAPEPAAPAAAVASAGIACAVDPAFPANLDVPEASSAPVIELASGPALLVVSDSGNGGEALVWPLSTDGPPRTIRLPIDKGASDDLEGSAFVDGRLFTITSSGAVRTYRPEGDGFVAVDAAYRLGPTPVSCADLGKVNCGRNYESLCLRAAPVAGRPRGWVGAKEESTFYPVTIGADGHLAIDATTKPLVVTGVAARSLSDCNFAPTGEMVVVTNVHDGNRALVLDESTGEPRFLDVAGLINLEAVSVDRAGRLYLYADTNGRPSGARRFTCTGWGSADAASGG